MLRRTVPLMLSLLAAVAARAEEPGGAPLAESTQVLKTLQADERAKNNPATAGKLSESLPRLPTQVPGATALKFAPPEQATQAEKELRRRKKAQKNWLVDGVEKLGREPKVRRGPGPQEDKDMPAEENTRTDSSDPDHILSLYAERKREDEAKAQARVATMPRRDPIAPFLQGWLGDSPVRGKFFDDFLGKTTTGAAAAPPAVGSGLEFSQVASGPAAIEQQSRTPSVAGQPNPYLAGLEPFARSEVGGGMLVQAASVPAMFGPPAPRSGSSSIDPIPSARTAEKKPALLAPTGNEKYFPQLKKF